MRSVGTLKGVLLCGSLLAAPEFAYAQATVDNTTVDEIIVTAQRREQRLQDVPVPVTAIGAKQMENQGIDSVRDLVRVTPGLAFAEGGPHSMPTLRGIGSRSSAPGDSSPVALYIDGVYLPAIGAGQFQFGAVERIEVLKGPQGTLFGRNATGGAINIITRAPSQVRAAEFEATYADFNERGLNAYVNIPITDQLSTNLDAFYVKDDGYTRDILTGYELDSKNDYGWRWKLALDAGDFATFTLAVDHSRIKSNQAFGSTVINNNNNTLRTDPTAVAGFGPGNVALSVIPYALSKQGGVSLTSDFTFEGWTLKSISAYRDSKSGGLIDNDYTNIAGSSQLFFTRNRTYTQEFLAASSGSPRLSWLTGLFLMNDVALRDPNISQSGASINLTVAELRTEAAAPFGEISYALTDNITLIGGLRYSYERKALVNSRNGDPRVNTSDSWRNLSYRATVQYTVDPQLNFYLTNSTGFKSGAYNSTAFDGTPVRPEEVTAWSVGMKSNKMGILFNADAFHYDYTDIQIQRAVDPATGTALLQNAASAKIKGAEVEVRAPLGEYLDAHLGVTYLHARYSSFPDAQVLVPRVGGGNISTSADATGNPLFRAPDWTVNAGLDFEHDLMGGIFRAAGSVYYSSEYSYEPSDRVKQDAYSTVHLRASWEPADERWRATVWVNNATDEVYYTSANLSTAGDNGNYAPPRQVGVTLRVRVW